MVEARITTEMVKRWSDRISVGDELRCKMFKDPDSKSDIEITDVCIVLRKYQYIAVTSKGTFSWVDLYIANKRRKTDEHEN